jgi:hypothetical protein
VTPTGCPEHQYLKMSAFPCHSTLVARCQMRLPGAALRLLIDNRNENSKRLHRIDKRFEVSIRNGQNEGCRTNSGWLPFPELSDLGIRILR